MATENGSSTNRSKRRKRDLENGDVSRHKDQRLEEKKRKKERKERTNVSHVRELFGELIDEEEEDLWSERG